MLKPNDSSENNGHTSPKTSSPWTKPPTSGSSGGPICIAAKRSDAMSSGEILLYMTLVWALIIAILVVSDDDDNFLT